MQRPLLLSGFMASGKSSVGPRVAALAGRAFVDLDALLEARFGAPVSQVFAEQGESVFRAAEREQLLAVLDRTDAPVVAVGGGCLVARDLRLAALDRAVVVTLDVSAAEVARRTEGRAASRPLLAGGDVATRAATLLEQRAEAYSEAHARFRTEGRSLEDIAQDVLAVWRRDPLAVAAGSASYAVDIGHGVAPALLPGFVSRASALLLVSDENVARLHASGLETALRATGKRLARFDFTPGEQHKTIASVERAWQTALESGLDRQSHLLGFGGGVTTDMTGFTAACYMRGVPWHSVPTTLLSMVDASVGGKTGVDLAAAKNAVGAFWQPESVVCDVAYLATEPARGFVSALAEVVKTALIGDPALFELLERDADAVLRREPALVTDVVRRCIRVKARVVSIDPRESGLRAVLNLGHTVGHALESQAGYERLSHGEAVSLGLVAAVRIGEKLGRTPAELARRTERLLARLGLPTGVEQEPVAAAAELIGHDKKRAGSKIRFVFAKELGHVDHEPVDLAEVRALTRSLAGA